MLAYNVGRYIGVAIDSILAQRVEFSVEIVICEDASSDDTREVIARYSDAGLFSFKKHFNSENIGLTKNLQKAIDLCAGEYVAYLDGDDYWTDCNKLTKQVRLMDENPGASICYHAVSLLKNGRLISDVVRSVPVRADILELARGNFIRSNSALFRRSAFFGFPESYYKSPVNDYFLFMLLAENGFVLRCDGVMAVYRIHASSDWSSRRDQDLYILDYLEKMMGVFGSEVDAIFKARHQKIAAQRFFSLIGAEGFSDRLSACLRYGDEFFQDELRKVVARSKLLSFSYWRTACKWWMTKIISRIGGV